MSEDRVAKAGTIGWVDLTVPNAVQVRDFYSRVVGWRAEPVDMNGYSDFNMCDPASGTPRAGVCHARGGNADLPPVWLIYVNVADLDASLAGCLELGGAVVGGTKEMAGYGRYAVIRDPAGAHLALFEPAG